MELRLSALKLWLLEVDCDRKQLPFETTLCYREVHVGHQRLSVWWDVNELVSGGQVKLEGRVVVDCLVTDLHDLSRSLLVEVLSQHWEKHRLDAVHFLDYKNLAESDCQLKSRVKLLVVVT